MRRLRCFLVGHRPIDLPGWEGEMAPVLSVTWGPRIRWTMRVCSHCGAAIGKWGKA